LTTIGETEKLEDDTVGELEKEIEHFKKMFELGTGEPLIKAGNESVDALDEEEVDQTKIVKGKK